jgi:hypothetical protein
MTPPPSRPSTLSLQYHYVDGAITSGDITTRLGQKIFVDS